jgi:hypothetical protein
MNRRAERRLALGDAGGTCDRTAELEELPSSPGYGSDSVASTALRTISAGWP